MKSKRRFIPLVFLGAIILSLLVIVPAFSATGTVRFYVPDDSNMPTSDDQDWGRQGGTAYLEVEDSDLDEDLVVTGEDQMASNGRFYVANVPVVDRNGDTFLNERDVDVVDGNNSPLDVNNVSADGRIDLGPGADASYSGPVKVNYKGAVRNDTGDAVKVRSQADPTGITVTLMETKPQSGVFYGMINLTEGNSVEGSGLKVGKNDVVTLRYSDADPSRTASKSLKVETTAPVFSETSPAHGAAGRANPEVEFNVVDSRSGLGDDEEEDIQVIFFIDNADGADQSEEYTVANDGSLTGIDGGFHARQRLPNNSAAESNATVYWWAVATDAAGNVAVSDRSAKVENDDGDEVSDPCDAQGFYGSDRSDTSGGAYGCQPYSIKIDNDDPVISAAATGAFWDTDSDDDDKTNEDPTKAKANMVLVKFNESLDASSVEASDFEVNDNTPVSADVYGGNKKNVFLTVSADLAPNSQPKVELVGQVEDLAGNRQTSGKVDDANDGIAPTLTVSLEGGMRPVTNGSVKVMVSSDEEVSTPSVAFQKVEDSGEESMYALGFATNVDAALTSARNYEATFTASGPGLYNVYVTAADATAGNTGKTGVSEGPIDLSDDTKAILFEFDNAVGEPMVMPDDETGSDNSDPFITIDFAAEGKEYMDNAGVDLDSYGKVTVVSASLKSPDMDAMDIADSLATTDNVIFLYKASDLAKGNHTVKVKAMDAAGNEKEFESTVKIVEREPFSLKLKPGWNLVSLPGTPTNTSLNAVIPADHPASTILSYDAEAGWTTAIRSDDGTWIGTLMTIDANSAYWIQTDTFDPIAVDIPRISAGTSVPPTISLSAGWNFVPVTDVSGSMNHGDAVSAAEYFSGTKVNRVYTFNTLMGTWDNVDLDDGMVMVGSGYWAHASDAGVIAP